MSEEITMDKLDMEQVHPKLRQVVESFLAQCRIPLTATVIGSYEYVGDAAYRDGVSFFDPAGYVSKPAGAIRWVKNKKGESKFRIVTRDVQFPRRADYEARRSFETPVERNAIKKLLAYVTPYSPSEIAESVVNHADRAARMWTGEFQKDASVINSLSNAVVMEEVRNLVAQGVTFKTEMFKHIAAASIEAYEETARRQKTTIMQHLVLMKHDGGVDVIYPDERVHVYPTFDALPDFIQQTVGLLRILGVGKEIPGVGVYMNNNMFWVLTKEGYDDGAKN